MSQKSRRGRKKKFPNLLRRSVWLEKETIAQLEIITTLAKAVTSSDTITFSDVVRKLLNKRIPALVNELTKIKMQKELKVDEALDACLSFTEYTEGSNQLDSLTSADQFAWEPKS